MINNNNPEKEVKKTIKKINKAFKKEKSTELRKISNSIIEKTLQTKNPQLIELSIISYSLSKILRKPHYRKTQKWKEFKQKINKKLKKAKKQEKLPEITKTIHEFNEEAGNYIETQIHHARVKQASRLYALGMSLSRAAETTGAEKEQLLQYVGSTKISEKYRTTIPVKKRYEITRKIIGE